MPSSSSVSRYIGVAIFFVVLVGLVLLLVVYDNKSARERFYNADLSTPSLSQGLSQNQKSVASLAPANPNAAAGLDQPNGVAPSNGIADSYSTVSQSVNNEVSGLGQVGPAGLNAVGSSSSSPTQSCYPRDRLTADDLLPKDAANSRWSQMNPAGQGDIGNQNYLNAGYHIGINTQGQTMKNANLQLRSEPPNPQTPVSPWNMSTIEFDTRGGRSFEIGSGSSL